jgi:hypothetical protein
MGTNPPGSVEVNADCGAETNLAHACTEREHNLHNTHKNIWKLAT